MPDSAAIVAFTERWSKAGGNELANSQLFLSEFCALFGFPPPDPATSANESNAYCFERKVHVPIGGGKTEMKRLDLYKRGCFVLEYKQGQEVAPKTALTLPIQGSPRPRPCNATRAPGRSSRPAPSDEPKFTYAASRI